ncbi:MAG: nuclear transport factor 2 family protein [Puniceicoccaceae bacterium]
MNDSELAKLANSYAQAWSSQDPESLAGFYSENGVLKINSGDPSVGRNEISRTAKSFMEAFPDMVVEMDSISREGERIIFRWTWTGTNTGPGGNGKSVNISGFESWKIGEDKLILESLGNYDEAEYERQMNSVS